MLLPRNCHVQGTGRVQALRDCGRIEVVQVSVVVKAVVCFIFATLCNGSGDENR